MVQLLALGIVTTMPMAISIGLVGKMVVHFVCQIDSMHNSQDPPSEQYLQIVAQMVQS